MRGHIDHFSRDRIEGWVVDEVDQARPVSLIVTCNDDFAGRFVANRYRGDLKQAGIGDGRHSFKFQFPKAMSPFVAQSVSIRREVDGKHMPGSPLVLPPISQFTDADKDAIKRYLLAESDDDELESRVAFLAEQLDSLLQRRASRVTERRQRAQIRQVEWRWRSQHSGVVDEPGLERPRALVIDEWIPQSDRDAGSNAVLGHMRSLQRLGFEVEFVAARELRASAAALETLSALDIRAHVAPYCASVEEILLRQSGGYDLIYLHRVQNAAKYGALARDHQRRARIVYSVADLHHIRVARQAEIEERPELARVARRIRLAEMNAAATSDVVITHSVVETDLLRRAVPHAQVETVPWSIVLRREPAPFAQRNGVAFIGGFSHDPNRDAARWLIGTIIPLVRQHAPIDCLLVGSDLPDDIRRLCEEGIVPVGHVPDLGTIFDRVRVTVAPLAYGAGIKGKVLDSLAAGVPCVCTPVAAEGLPLPLSLANCVAADAEGIAALLQRLHQDAAENAALGAAGRDFVSAFCSEQAVDAGMRRVVGAALLARSGVAQPGM